MSIARRLEALKDTYAGSTPLEKDRSARGQKLMKAVDDVWRTMVREFPVAERREKRQHMNRIEKAHGALEKAIKNWLVEIGDWD